MSMNRLGKKKAQICADVIGRPVYRASTHRGPVAVCWVSRTECCDVDYEEKKQLTNIGPCHCGHGWHESEPDPIPTLTRKTK